MGTTLPQFTGDRARFVEGARRAEALGLDSIWVFDHLWPLTGGKERPVLECWTALSWVAAATSTIRVGTLVTRSSLRHPAVLAKMAATVASIAPGRVTIAIGSGDEASRDENEAYGIPYFAGDARIEELLSTVRVVSAYLTGEPVSMTDDYVTIEDLPPSPAAETPPTIWVGGRSDDVLEVAGTIAGGWNGWGGTPERFAQDAATVAGYAGGRSVELSWGGLVMLGSDDHAAESKLGDRSRRGWIVGGPERVGDRLREFVDGGARHVIVTLPDPHGHGVYELLAGRVRPRLQS